MWATCGHCMGPSQGSYYSNIALWEVMSVCLSACLILTVMFELEVDTVHLAASQCAVGEFFFPEEFRPSHYLVW